MPERLTTLPHDFEFTEEVRSLISLVGSIRLDGKANCVMLKPDSDGLYPTDNGNNYVATAIYKPKAVRQWLGFQVDILHFHDGPDVQTTGDGYRLGDGTSQYEWNGSAWVISTGNWNTEADIANNISTFPTTSRQIQVFAKLSTTNARVTPLLSAIRIAWTGKVEIFEDIVYRSLVPLMRQTRLISDFNIRVPIPGGLTLDVMNAVRGANYKFTVVDVEAVFNHNLDPDHYNNLLSSYDGSTGKATLATAIPVGQNAFCRLVVQPQVSVENTAQDYIELASTPAIQITNIEAVDSQSLSLTVGTVNKSTMAAIVIPPPYRFTLRFTMIALTSGGVDTMRMLRALVAIVESNPTIRSTATDEEYRLWMINEFTTQTEPTAANLQQQMAVFEILDILTYERQAQSAKGVTNINLGLSR